MLGGFLRQPEIFCGALLCLCEDASIQVLQNVLQAVDCDAASAVILYSELSTTLSSLVPLLASTAESGC